MKIRYVRETKHFERSPVFLWLELISLLVSCFVSFCFVLNRTITRNRVTFFVYCKLLFRLVMLILEVLLYPVWFISWFVKNCEILLLQLSDRMIHLALGTVFETCCSYPITSMYGDKWDSRAVMYFMAGDYKPISTEISGAAVVSWCTSWLCGYKRK